MCSVLTAPRICARGVSKRGRGRGRCGAGLPWGVAVGVVVSARTGRCDAHGTDVSQETE